MVDAAILPLLARKFFPHPFHQPPQQPLLHCRLARLDLTEADISHPKLPCQPFDRVPQRFAVEP